MSKVISFETGKRRKPEAKVSRNSFLLWEFAQSVDTLVTSCVMEKGLPPEEVAAILAHRLGTLIQATDERAPEVKQFCLRVIERLNLPNDSDDEAS